MRRSVLFRTLITATAAFGAAHCATSGSVGDLRARAAFDLACPAESLQVQSLAERTYGVDGCGKRATYVWAYQNQSWLLDARSGASTEGSAAAPPGGATPSAAPSNAAAASNPSPAASVVAGPSAPQAPRASAPAAADPKAAADAKAEAKAACDSAQDYRRRAASSSGAAQAGLVRMAERKEAECKGQGQDR